MLNEHDLKDWGILSMEHPEYANSFPAKKENNSLRDPAYEGKAEGFTAKRESDPHGKSAKEFGSKLDAGKSPVFQGLLDYFPRACLAVADVSARGAAKYAWKGWETVPDGVNRYSNALGRHIVNEAIEGSYDSDGFLHKAQIAWNAFAALELFLREKE